MKGLKMFKGNLFVENNDFIKLENAELLAQEIENLIYSDPKSCFWDTDRGLDRKIIFGQIKSQIESEVRNKILKYFKDRVLEVINIKIETGKKTLVTGEISTVYGKININKEVL